VSLALVLVLALAEGARDPDVVAGEAAYREGRWDDASVAFDAAYRRSGNPTFLYTRAQVERKAGRCDVAIGLFEKFLATGPPEAAGKAAQEYLDECRASVAVADPVEPPPPRVEIDPVDSLPPDDPPKRWPKDPLAITLVATGGVAMAAGAGLLAFAFRGMRLANTARNDREYARNVERARSMQISGATLLPLGVALAIGGAVRWEVLAKRERSRRVAVGVSPRGIAIAGRF
jgi:hypothetical protein